MTSKELLDAQRLWATAEYRQLDPVQRGVKMVLEDNYSFRDAAKVLDIHHSLIYRAIDATKKGRSIGHNGRASFFTDEELESLMNDLRTLSLDPDDPPLTYVRIRSVVTSRNIFYDQITSISFR